MKLIGSTLMIVGGIFLFWAVFIFDTSVSVGGYGFGGRVNNIGLLNDKRNYITISGLMFVVGLVIFLFDKNQQKISHKNENNDSGFVGDNKNQKLWTNSRDLTDDGYRIYLVKKFNIEKNDALAKIIADEKTFSNIEDALIHADKIDKLNQDQHIISSPKEEILDLPDDIQNEIQQLSESLRKYNYEITGYDKNKCVWEVSSSGGKFDQNLKKLRDLLKNFE
jgi:hypothetical protein